MKPFRWKRERLQTFLEPHEAALLRQVVSEIRNLLSDAHSEVRSADDAEGEPGGFDVNRQREAEPVGEPGGFDVNRQSEKSSTNADSVRARLLPDGHRSDPELAQDYRWLTEAGLRREKLADADLLLATVDQDGGRVELDENGAEAWLRTINDVRLAIGVGLDVQEGDDPTVRAEEGMDPRWAAYSWLTAVQGLLVDVLASRTETGT